MSIMGSKTDREAIIFWTVFPVFVAFILGIAWLLQPSEVEIKTVSEFECNSNSEVCTIKSEDGTEFKYKMLSN